MAAEVCAALDGLVEEYVELHAAMMEEHAAMEAAQRDGYFAMSKARVTMGVSITVSQSLIDAQADAPLSSTRSRALPRSKGHWAAVALACQQNRPAGRA